MSAHPVAVGWGPVPGTFVLLRSTARSRRPPRRCVEQSHVVLATRDGDRDRLVAAFRELVEVHLAGVTPARR
jgi:hypothetical protein